VLGIGVLAANASEWRKKVSGATEPPGNFSAARRHSARDLKVKIQKTQKNAKERLNFQYGELLAKLIRTRDFFVADWRAVVEGQVGAGVKGPTRNI
jgi:hypothetical protein